MQNQNQNQAPPHFPNLFNPPAPPPPRSALQSLPLPARQLPDVPPPPPPNPLDAWDADVLLRAHLNRIAEPKGNTDPDMLKARIRMFRGRVRELEHLRFQLHPRASPELDKELANVYYKRKILLWVTFPILELPTEILSNIFRLVVWSSNGADQATMHRLNLTWVNRRFREIAINDQTLWNSVWFRDSPPWTRSLKFIERAGTAPLDLRINEKDPKGDAPRVFITVEQIGQILDAVLEKIAQIRILVIVLHDWDVAYTVMRRFYHAGPAPLLERFEIHRTGLPYLWATPPATLTETGGRALPLNPFPLPRLRWLCLNGLAVDWYKLPLTNLKTIDIRRVSLHACPTSAMWKQMISSSPGLYKLAVDAAGPQWSAHDHATVQAVALPHLRELLVGDMSVLFAIFILAHMDAPRIMNLSLINLSGQDYAPLLESLTGRFPEVRMLSMYTLEIGQSEDNVRRLVRWLETMPRLRLLKVAQAKAHVLDAFLADPRDYRDPEPDQDADPAADADANAAQGADAAQGGDGDEMEVQTETPPEAQNDAKPKEEEKRPILCPEMDTLHFQSLDAENVVGFARGRKALGVPFRKVYTPMPIVAGMEMIPEADRLKLRDEVTEAFLMIYHLAVTPEEDKLHEEMMASLPSGL